jgi:branched-chain amino acid transport system substrate-binding protein
MNTKLKLFGLLIIIFVLGVSYPSIGAEKIKLGLVGPFTGGLAIPGADMKRGAQLAVEEINSKGGINKREIELFIENDEGVPAKSVNASEKLVIKDNVLTVIGSYSSSCTLANMKVTQKYEVPQICPISVATAITQSGNKFIFRNCATNPMQIGQLADYAISAFKLKRVGVMYVNTDFGRGIRDVWAEKAAQYKIQLAVDLPCHESDTDFFSYLTKVKGINPDAILIGANITQATQIVLQSKNLDLRSQILGVGTFSDNEFWELTKGKGEGIVHISYFEPESPDPKIRQFAKDFEKQFNKVPGMFAAAVYEALYIFEDAVKRVGTDFTDMKKWRLAMREAIASTKNLPGVQGGPTTFGPDGQADKKVYIVRWQQGKRVILYPPQK